VDKTTMADVLESHVAYWKELSETECPGQDKAKRIYEKLIQAPASVEAYTNIIGTYARDSLKLHCDECEQDVEAIVILADKNEMLDPYETSPLSFCGPCLRKAAALVTPDKYHGLGRRGWYWFKVSSWLHNRRVDAANWLTLNHNRDWKEDRDGNRCLVCEKWFYVGQLNLFRKWRFYRGDCPYCVKHDTLVVYLRDRDGGISG
jgi:hypothetical protein